LAFGTKHRPKRFLCLDGGVAASYSQPRSMRHCCQRVGTISGWSPPLPPRSGVRIEQLPGLPLPQIADGTSRGRNFYLPTRCGTRARDTKPYGEDDRRVFWIDNQEILRIPSLPPFVCRQSANQTLIYLSESDALWLFMATVNEAES
jgi:hypothetical protein